ncbi:DUF3899 domain-containing protein [Fictibacillus nanhaiensis]|uniref:DUF3899 domain-containing protein n=1 Tax=Fictibacillus nanhaiensis TaxID=742169 RepID=UPI001C96DDB7|nr:DUF3899 domain-containing protein [Fictibacillus nanhaiensis]MBY6036332.1 DUF3899 domain-containing protein [Fictibacillus nanhaiensis]
MNPNFNRFLIITGISIVISLIVALSTSGSFTLEKYVNTLFYFAIIIALIGIAMFVLNGGFFDFFSYSVKKVARSLSRTPELHDEISFKSNFRFSERVNVSYMKLFLYSGLFLTFLSIAVAYVL